MNGREHYMRAMSLIKDVEDIETKLDGEMFETDVALALNANMMRQLKKAELHLMASGLKATYDR